MAHYQQLRLHAELVQKVQEPVQIDVVEGWLHFVHHVKRGRPAPKNSKQERQCHQAALASRKKREPTDVLACGPNFEVDTGLENVGWVRQEQRALAAGEQHCHEIAEIFCDIVKCSFENCDYLGVDGPYYLAELSPRARDIMELALEELVTFF